MSYRIEIKDDRTGKKISYPVIEPEPDGKCELCGKMDELRPYGPGGKRICWDCGQLDPERTQHNFRIQLLGMKGKLK